MLVEGRYLSKLSQSSGGGGADCVLELCVSLSHGCHPPFKLQVWGNF